MNPRAPGLVVLVFLSGWSGLVYQVLWREELALVSGRTWEATAMVLALFMGGLAIGARLAGQWADRVRRPVLVFSWLETGVGFCALLVPLALESLEPVHRGVWGLMGGGGGAALLGGAAVALVLLPATVLMGATLPMLARHAAAGSFGRDLPILYGANTLGAAVGALSAVFVLLPALGRSVSLLIAVFVTMLVAFLAARLARRVAPVTVVAPVVTERQKGGWGLLAIAFGSGFVSLGLEVFWTQSLALTLGSSTYAFGLMLAALLLGLGAAALFSGVWIGRGGDPWVLVCAALLGGGVLAGAGTVLIGQVPWIAAWLTLHFGENFTLHSLGTFLVALALIGPPGFLLGLALPGLIVAGRRLGAEGRVAGRLYAADSIGSVLGPLVAGFVVLPWIGSRRGLLAGGALLALGGLALAVARGRWRGVALAGAGAAVALGVALPPWDLKLAASGFHLYALRHKEIGLRKVLESEELLWFREGAQGSVAVFDYTGRSGEKLRTYAMNGKFEGSTNRTDMQTQTRIAEIPLALSPREPSEIFVLGLGTGVTVASALRFPVERVDVCEISPEVAFIAKEYFGEVNQGALDDPRVELRLEDGRLWLKLSGRRYDAILSEPSNPWMAGVASLFTLESFKTMRAALRPGGVACQWVQAYLLDEERFRIVLRTWLAVFPESFAVLTSLETTDILLIGLVECEQGCWRPESAAIAERFAARAPYPAGEEYAPSGLADAVEGFLAGPQGLAAWAGKGRLNTDDHPILQYQAPLDLYRREARVDRWERLPEILEGAYDFVEGLSSFEEQTLLEGRAWLETMLGLKGAALSAAELPAAAVEGLIVRLEELARKPGAEQSWVPAFLIGKFSCFGSLPDRPGWYGVFAPGFPRARALEALERATRLGPDKLDPLLHLTAVLERGFDGTFGGPGASLEEALAGALRALEIDPTSESAVLLAARLYLAQGRSEEARELLRSFLARGPSANVETYLRALGASNRAGLTERNR